MRNFILTAFALGTLCVVSQFVCGADSKTNEWNAASEIPLNKFVIQSHRGAGELAPENTLEAFQLGWKLGTVPECDLRTTKDGVIVTFHDENFKRVVKGTSAELQKKGVADLTWPELSKLDVGAWKGGDFVGRRVSKIEEAFALMEGHPERHLYLDIKNVDLKQLAGIVHDFHVEKQITLATPKHSIVQEWKSLVPESDTLLWMGGSEEELKTKFAEARRANFAGITQLQIHVHLVPKKENAFTPSDEFLTGVGKELREHGILFQSLPWKTTAAEVYWKLLDLGVASFATDHPDATLEAVRKYYERKARVKANGGL